MNTGSATATANSCTYTIFPPSSAAAGITSTVQQTPICGFNQDANYYCPWAFGDGAAATILPTLAGIYKYANANCNVKSAGIANCNAVRKQYSTIVTTALQWSLLLLNSPQNGQGIATGAYVVNNAVCVQKTITAAYFGLGSAAYGVAAVVASISAMMF